MFSVKSLLVITKVLLMKKHLVAVLLKSLSSENELSIMCPKYLN